MADIDVGTLVAHLAIEDEISETIKKIGEKVVEFALEMDSAFGEIVLAAGTMTVAIGAVTAAVVTLAVKGSEINDISESFDRLAGSAGNASDILAEMQKGTAGTIDNIALMTSANKLLESGVEANAKTFGTMTAAARVLSREGFGSLPDVMAQVDRGMQTGLLRGPLLKSLHIDLAKAEEDYAKKLGVTRSELDSQAKLFADRGALVEGLSKKVEAAGEQELNFKEKIEAANVSFHNWMEELEGAIAASPHVNAAFDAIADAIQKAFGGSGKDAIELIVGWINKFADAVKTYGPVVVAWLGKLKDEVVEIYTEVKRAWDAVPDWLKKIAEEATLAGIAVWGVHSAVTSVTDEDVLSKLASLAQIFSTIASFKGTLVSLAGQAATVFGLGWYGFATALEGIGTWALAAVGPIGWLTAALGLLAFTYRNEFGDALKSTGEIAKSSGEIALSLGGSFLDLTDSALDAAAGLFKMPPALKEVKNSAKDLGVQIELTTPAVDPFVEKIKNATSFFQVWALALHEISDELASIVIWMNGLKIPDVKPPPGFVPQATSGNGGPIDVPKAALDSGFQITSAAAEALRLHNIELKKAEDSITESAKAAQLQAEAYFGLFGSNVAQLPKMQAEGYAGALQKVLDATGSLSPKLQAVYEKLQMLNPKFGEMMQKAKEGADAQAHTNDLIIQGWFGRLQMLSKLTGSFAINQNPLSPNFGKNTFSADISAIQNQFNQQGIPTLTSLGPPPDREGQNSMFAPGVLNKRLTQFRPFQDFSGQQTGIDAAAAVVGALQGGGSVTQAAAGAVGQDIGKSISKNLSKSLESSTGLKSILGNAFSSMIPFVGSLVGPLVGKIMDAFAGGEGHKANQLRDSLKAQLTTAITGLENDPDIQAALNKFNTAGNQKDVQAAFDATKAAAQKVTDTMSKYNLSLNDLGTATDKVSKSSKDLIGDFTTLVNVGFSVDQIAKGATTQLNNLILSALDAKTKLPASLQPFLESLAKAGGLSDEVKRKLLGIADPVPWQTMKDTADKYKISIDSLGAAFQQAKLDDDAKQIAADWKLLIDNGADANAVMEGMKGSVQDIIDRFFKFGGTIPDAMRPVIEQMSKAGLLIDNGPTGLGGKLTDLTQLNWSHDLTDDIQALIDKIGLLIDKLTGTDSLTAALNGLPNPTVHVGVQYDTQPAPGDTSGGRGVGGGATTSPDYTPGNGYLPDGSIDPNGPFADQLPHHAKGGIVRKREVAVVGEEPEAIIPLNQALPGRSSGSLNISITAWDGQSVQQWLDRGGDRQLATALIQKFPDAGKLFGV